MVVASQLLFAPCDAATKLDISPRGRTRLPTLRRGAGRVVLCRPASATRQEALSPDAAAAFLWCSDGLVIARFVSSLQPHAWDEDSDEERAAGSGAGPSRPGQIMELPSPIGYHGAAMLLPAAYAAHAGLLQGPVAVACFPMVVPFSTPSVPPELWLANKRARAFHRCCVLGVYLQGAFSLFKFAHGDLIGGTYDAIQALMGAYAVSPDGQQFLPSYMMMAGFNGVLGTFQLFQAYHGVPLHYLPLWSMLPSAISLANTYFCWQFIKEIKAINEGLNYSGPQDSCFVSLMGGDWWPASLDTQVRRPEQEGTTGGLSNRFSPFAGDGFRLGER